MKIGNYLRIPRIIKVVLSRFLIYLGILFFLYYIINTTLIIYLYGDAVEHHEDQSLEDIVNSVLEIPYFKKDFVIDRPEYIKTLTPEE